VDRVPLDQLKQELRRELIGPALTARYTEWARQEPALAQLDGPVQLLRFLRGRPAPERGDAVLRALLARAWSEPIAGRLVLHALLPGLKAIARRLLAGADEREELWSALLTIAWERIRSYPLDRRPRRIAANLLLDTLRPTLCAVRSSHASELSTALESRELRPAWPTAEGGDLDALLGEAVAAGAITGREAELVAVTRFDGIPLAHIATATGASYNTVKVRRQRAERRLLVWLGHPPVPRDPKNDLPVVPRSPALGREPTPVLLIPRPLEGR
jgi:DNA-directed RNA polymerase specialized sigma24 family protein